MTTKTIEPVRKQIGVAVSQQKAFEVFTSQMSSWWLPSHFIGNKPFSEIVIEPHAGGRWFERSDEGDECDWGRVLVWEPPDRVVLSWQIDSRWQYSATASSQVEVRFAVEGPEQTRVELEHRGIEGLGGEAAELRSAFDGKGGWAGLLAAYSRALG